MYLFPCFRNRFGSSDCKCQMHRSLIAMSNRVDSWCIGSKSGWFIEPEALASAYDRADQLLFLVLYKQKHEVLVAWKGISYKARLDKQVSIMNERSQLLQGYSGWSLAECGIIPFGCSRSPVRPPIAAEVGLDPPVNDVGPRLCPVRVSDPRFCECCQMSLNGEKQYNDHLIGEKHLKNMRRTRRAWHA